MGPVVVMARPRNWARGVDHVRSGEGEEDVDEDEGEGEGEDGDGDEDEDVDEARRAADGARSSRGEQRVAARSRVSC